MESELKTKLMSAVDRCQVRRSGLNSNVGFDFANGDIAINYVLGYHSYLLKYLFAVPISYFSPHFMSISIESFCNYGFTTTDAFPNPILF